jgi:hypothetical protein
MDDDDDEDDDSEAEGVRNIDCFFSFLLNHQINIFRMMLEMN